jgi:hypothetical protein
LNFQGMRDFRTEDPRQLRQDLQRQNQRLEDGFGEVERTTMERGRTVKVLQASYQARHGDVVLAGYNEDTTILLPESKPETANRVVRVVRVAGGATITVAAPSRQSVNGAASTTVTTTGWRDYLDDGFGNWWGPAV